MTRRPFLLRASGSLILGASLLATTVAHAGLIHTVAGTGVPGDGADSIHATDSTLDNPQGIAVAPDGTLYIADSYNHVVRKVDSLGIVTTIAAFSVPLDLAIAPDGTVFATGFSNVYRITEDGEVTALLDSGYGDSGDGGLAINALAKAPTGIAVDSAGNVFFADRGTHKVRRIGQDGIIVTVAGIGVEGAGGDGGQATAASLNAPYDVAVGPDGRLYIADTGNARLRIVEPDGRIWTTLATSAGVWFAEVDDKGDVYFGSRSRGEVRRLDWDLSVVAGQVFTGYSGDGGVATDARMLQPRRIAFGPAGNMFIAEEGNHVVRKVVLSDHTTHVSDIDADGWSDILWRNALTGEVQAWRTGDAALSFDIGEMADTAWEITATGDFDADGSSDLFWRNEADGRNMIWPGGRIADFRPVTRLADTEWSIAGIGDFNGDGAADLLWRHAGTGAGSIWPSADSTRGYAITRIKDPNWQVVAVADFNGDGRSDLFWRNYSYGGNRIWLSANHTALRAVSGLGNLAWDIAGTGDFDGDGLADIVWRNGASGGAVVWKAADSTRAWVAGAAPLSMEVAAVADFNGDRKSDLLWRDAVSGTNRAWLSGQVSTPLDVASLPGVEWEVVP